MKCRARRGPFSFSWLWALVVALAGSAGCAQFWSLGSGERRDDASWEELMRSADRFRESGDSERALVGYLRALHHEPDRPLARVRLAQLQLPRDPARAGAGFRRVLAVEPDDSRALAGLGMSALALGRLEEARAAFEKAAQRAPESALAHAGGAVALDLLGRPEEAHDQLSIARNFHPDEAWLLNNLGVSRLLAGDWAGAEAALRVATELEPDDPAAFNNLGLALGRQGRYREALVAFQHAGSERAARNNLGFVHFLNGQYPEAVAQYELALAAEGGEARVVLENLNAALDVMERKPANRADGKLH